MISNQMVLNILDIPDQFYLNRDQHRLANFYFAKQGPLRLKTKQQNHKTKHHLLIHYFIKEETFTKGHHNTPKYTSS